MVIKTEVCAFSDTRIYPGHGVRMIRRDGQVSASKDQCQRLRTHLTHEPFNFPGPGLGLRAKPWRAASRNRRGETGGRLSRKLSSICRAATTSSFCGVELYALSVCDVASHLA